MRTSARKWAYALSVPIICYILSFGPVYGYFLARNWLPQSITTFYGPLLFLSQFGGLWNPLIIYLILCEMVLWRGH